MLVAPASATSTDFEGKAATEVLATLKTKGRAPKTGYARTQFGAAWADVDHNGCDTRNDILKRDMTDVTFKAGTHDCIVMTGTLADPYTGKTISFKRGNKTSSAVQIDHVVALSDAWQKGAQKLSASQRKNLANDPYNLLAVDGPSNQQKSDGDAATWLPKNKSFRCEYVARQIGVKAKYSLWVTKAERKAMTKVLATCPTQTVPLNDEAQATADAAEAQRKAEEEAAAKAAAEEAQRQAEAQQQQQQQQQDANVYYPNCAAVRAAGKAPLYQGQPGYSTKLDRDRDGVACE
ncbi:GmrSD restriction endonuclease domain-containing protein [Bifidobacterium parmae]